MKIPLKTNTFIICSVYVIVSRGDIVPAKGFLHLHVCVHALQAHISSIYKHFDETVFKSTLRYYWK